MVPEDNITPADLDRIIFHTSQLIDLANDIDRNRRDQEFVNLGGHIDYVFDETVFEMFVSPLDRRLAISSLYLPDISQKSGLHESWAKFEAQSALIGAEFLFGGRLPGHTKPGETQPIYMTPWHRLELVHRVSAMTDRCARLAREHLPDLQKELEAKRQLFNRLKSFKLKDVRDLLLRRDLTRIASQGRDQLDAKGDWEDKYTARYAATREAAKMLVDSRYSEPLDQLARLGSDAVAGRIRTVSSEVISGLEAFPYADIEKLKEVSDKWYYRLKRESERPYYRTKRKDGSLRSDANSLALIQHWVRHSSKTKRLSRVIFVTHDNMLFNAYRAWQTSLKPGDPDYLQPFFVRRSIQFAPLINLRAAESDLIHSTHFQEMASSLFAQIADAVEVSFTDVYLENLLTGRESDGLTAYYRERDALSIKLKDLRSKALSSVSRADQVKWARNKQAVFKAIGETWQDVERLAIGSFHDHVMRRVEDDKAAFGVKLKFEPSTLGAEAVAREVARSIDELVDRSEQLWGPLVREFIISSTPKTLVEVGRAPLTDWCTLRSGIQVNELVQSILSDKADDRPSVAESVRALELDDLFIMATSLALRLADWTSAATYAGLAARRAKRNKSPQFYDAAFLHALSLRFKIGQMSTHFANNSEENRRESFFRMAQTFKEASDILYEILEAKKDDLSLDRARALSELAALQLFVFSSLKVAGVKEGAEVEGLQPETMWQNARQNLRDVMALLLQIEADERLRKNRVERQVIFNIACSEVLKFVYSQTYVRDETIREATSRLEVIERAKTPIPAIVKLSAAYFKRLFGDGAEETMVEIDFQFDRMKDVALPLDSQLAKAMKDALPRLMAMPK